MTWRNGYIPESDLIIFKRGWNQTDGDWYWGLTPATYARHSALVERAYARTGRILSPSDGWSTVRPMPAQEIARRIYGNGAAVPGTSSHGGFWEGRETLAIDYGNWAYVYDGKGGQAAFYDDARAVGLSPGLIAATRGYPEEPWHVIDLNPRSMPAFAFADARPLTLQTMSEEDDMARLIKFDAGVLPNDPTFLIAPGFLYCHNDAEEQRVDKYLYGTDIKSLGVEDFYRALKTHGLHGAAGSWGAPPESWSLPAPGKAYVEAPGTKG